MCPDSAIAKYIKCSHTNATAILKVIAQDAWKSMDAALRDSKYFSLQTDDTTDLSMTQQMALCFEGGFNNFCETVRCIFFQVGRCNKSYS